MKSYMWKTIVYNFENYLCKSFTHKINLQHEINLGLFLNNQRFFLFNAVICKMAEIIEEVVKALAVVPVDKKTTITKPSMSACAWENKKL